MTKSFILGKNEMVSVLTIKIVRAFNIKSKENLS